MGRDLRLVAIDDESETKDEAKGPFTNINYKSFSSFEAISRACHFDLVKADIILVDINMVNWNLPPDLQWSSIGAGTGLPLVGPILALPFLRSNRPSAMFLVSQFWNDVASANNGPLITALALILSVTEHQPHNIAQAREWLQNVAHNKHPEYQLIGQTKNEDGLRSAIRRYRASISYHCASQNMRLRGVQRAIELFSLLEQRHNGLVPKDLEFEGETISIGFDFSNGETDFINLPSLFADFYLGADRNAVYFNRRQVQAINDLLSGLLRKTDWCSDTEHSLFETVVNLLSHLEQRNANEEVDFQELMERSPELWEPWNRFQVRRTAMLFAWVEAAWQEHPHLYSQSVRDAIARRQPINVRVYSKLGIHAEDQGKRYARILMASDRIPNEAYRGSFMKNGAYQGKKDWIARAYGLGVQEGKTIRWAKRQETNLTDAEVDLCRDYARTHLGWNNRPANPWPDWMLRNDPSAEESDR